MSKETLQNKYNPRRVLPEFSRFTPNVSDVDISFRSAINDSSRLLKVYYVEKNRRVGGPGQKKVLQWC